MAQNKFTIAYLLILISCLSLSAQDKTQKDETPTIIVGDSIAGSRDPINPLAPAKAAFYSAIIPGLGQAYNKKYWKIPIVWGAIGTGIYYYNRNNKQYNRYRDAYKSRLAGLTNDEFYIDSDGNQLETPSVTTDGLERGQTFYRRNKELSLLVTIGFYALNIIDANVDAHLMQFNIDENLSLVPYYKLNELDNSYSNLGLSLNLKF